MVNQPFQLAALLLLLACGVQNKPTESKLSRIIGENNLVRIGDEDPRKNTIEAIGQMAVGCTATHLGNGIAITAGHCFTSLATTDDVEKIDCSSYQYETTWGKVYGFRGYLTSQCSRVLALEYSSTHDYAIFSVNPIPTHALTMNRNLPRVGENISIFSYPRRRPMEWSGSCLVESFLTDNNANYFAYSCDTQDGSSGAPVLDADLNLLGIHSFYNDTIDRNCGEPLALIPVQEHLKI